MQKCHVLLLGLRYWTALCLASVFGANMGDFFAHNLGLGHVAGLPFLAVALPQFSRSNDSIMSRTRLTTGWPSLWCALRRLTSPIFLVAISGCPDPGSWRA